MQINRLFEIVYILMNNKTVTAKELAGRFEVSVRTIYRDVDTLSAAGIPIYMSKGKGGGISLLENFVLNKSVLSESEQNEILAALQGLSSLNLPDASAVLDKLGILFNKNTVNWIDIDFSHWGSDNKEKEKFNVLKHAILSRNIAAFDYYAPNREMARRIAEPLQIYFKEKAWYLKAFCTKKQDYRTFKIKRMKNVEIIDETFSRELQSNDAENLEINDTTKIVLRFSKPAFSRIYDELSDIFVIQQDKNSLTAEIYCPDEEWIYSYILSYGESAEVLEPAHIREIIKNKLQVSLKQYL